MATPRNRQPETPAEAGQTASELAERHQPKRRTSKSRAPQRSAQPPAQKPKHPPRERSARERREYADSDERAERSEKPEQRKLPFRNSNSIVSWMTPDIFTRRIARAGGAIVVAIFVVVGFYVAYQVLAGSRFFELRQVVVEGNVLLTNQAINEMVRSVAQRSVLKADLVKIQEKLKGEELIKEVEVRRLLPDMLRVTLKEREPYTRARLSTKVEVCVDRDGVIFGNPSLLRTNPEPPWIIGLAESGERMTEINRQRVLTYQQLLSELDGAQPSLSSRIREVSFDNVQGVRVILADSQIPVLLGNEDFRTRLNAALDVLDAVRRKDPDSLNVLRIGDAEKLLSGAKIAYLNAMTPKRVVVGLDE